MDVLVREGDTAHQSVVRVEHDVEAAVVVLAERMRRIRRHGMRLHVAREADLEGDPPVVAIVREGGVLDETRRVPHAVHSADVHGFPHRLGAVSFTCMAGTCEIVRARVLEGAYMRLGRIAYFATGKVEADDTLLPIRDRQLGQLL